MPKTANERVRWSAALLIALSLAACRTADDGAVDAQSMTGVERSTVADAAITPETSRPLGTFASEADAVAAARAAGLGPGVYGLAMAGDVSLAITADGTVYRRQQSMVPVEPSRPAQRPPQ